MALNASDWLPDDPRRDEAVRRLITERVDGILKLAEALVGDQLMALAVQLEMFRKLHLSSSNLESTAAGIHDTHLRDAPEPAGVEWACASGDRAAAVVSACRLIDKRRSGRQWWQWTGELDTIGGVRTTQFTLRGWRRGVERVDRRVVVAALKIAMVEDARELKGLQS